MLVVSTPSGSSVIAAALTVEPSRSGLGASTWPGAFIGGLLSTGPGRVRRQPPRREGLPRPAGGPLRVLGRAASARSPTRRPAHRRTANPTPPRRAASTPTRPGGTGEASAPPR